MKWEKGGGGGSRHSGHFRLRLVRGDRGWNRTMLPLGLKSLGPPLARSFGPVQSTQFAVDPCCSWRISATAVGPIDTPPLVSDLDEKRFHFFLVYAPGALPRQPRLSFWGRARRF